MNPSLPRAIVLTAGLGTRLDPLTRGRAKPAVPVAGTPLVLRVLQWLARQQVHEVVLNLHYKPETITRYVGHGAGAGVAVRYSWEPTILGTAGGPREAIELLGPRFFVINGDTLTDLDLAQMRTAHEARGAAVTMAMMSNPAPERYGGATVDSDGWVEGFAPAGKGSPFHFVGVQLMEASVLASVPKGQPAETIGGVYDTLLAEQPRSVYAHVVDTRFHDIGTPGDYLATSLALAATDGHVTCPIGARSVVHPTAILTRTAIWDEVLIGEGCRLTECVFADHAVLPPHSVFERQAIVSAEGRAPRDHERQLGDLLLTPIDGRPLKV